MSAHVGVFVTQQLKYTPLYC